jgi:hypothetical protein
LYGSVPKLHYINKQNMYTCPMHLNIKQVTPGTCSICGMNLVLADDKHNNSSSTPNIIHKEKESLLPVFVIFAILLILVAIVELIQGRFQLLESLRVYMAGFFIIFGGLKLFDLKGFADTYMTYDILAKKTRTYALVYPFIELALGLSYAFGFALQATNIITFIVMSIGSIGVFKAVLGKQKIRCACLGTYFKLPMTTVTIIEDVSMAVMALIMIIILF